MISHKKRIADALRDMEGMGKDEKIVFPVFTSRDFITEYKVPENSMRKLAGEAVNILATKKEVANPEGNADEMSKALRKAELFYLSVKAEAVKRLRYTPEVDEVLSYTITPTKCSIEGDLFTLTFPFLFPHRSAYHKTKLFGYEVAAAIKREDLSSWKKDREFIAVFRFEYGPEIDRSRFRDNDNTEAKWLLDSLIGTIIPDDGPDFCDLIYTSRAGNETRTILYVFPKENADTYLRAFLF